LHPKSRHVFVFKTFFYFTGSDLVDSDAKAVADIIEVSVY